MTERPTTPTPPSNEFDFYRIYRRVLGVIAKRSWAFALTFIAIIGVTVAYLVTAPRIYEAKTSIIIESSTPQALGQNFRDIVDMELGGWWSAHEYMQTQYAVLRSERLASDVARRLTSDQRARLGVADGEAGTSAAAKIIRGSIEIDPIKESRVVYVIVHYPDPEAATLIANEVAQT